MERSGVNAGFLFLSLWLVNYRKALKRAKVNQFIFSKLIRPSSDAELFMSRT